MKYPSEHQQIVNRLLKGKFIIYPDPLFNIIEKSEDYPDFFKYSFGYELNVEAEFAYLSSEHTTEKGTRDFALFLAILCRELDYSNENFREKVEFGEFDINETHNLLKQSSKWEILQKTSVEDFEGFIKTWSNRNLLKSDKGRFKFTKAVKIFFNYAVNLAEEKLQADKIQ